MFLNNYIIRIVLSSSPPVEVQPGRKRKVMTALNSQKEKSSSRKRVLITVLMVLVVLGILVTAGYFSESSFNAHHICIPNGALFPT